MVDPKTAAELIRQHFASLTTEQFLRNLDRAYPGIFAHSEENAKHLDQVKICEKPDFEPKEQESPEEKDLLSTEFSGDE